MISFFICLAVLVAGYFIYGGIVERRFGPDDRVTPAYALNDGVDYVPMSRRRILLIQLLNIAGLGPIWGAVCGAMWGPSVFIWITLGTLLAGGVHDFASGFISMRNDGKSISEVCGNYMGSSVRNLMRVFSVLLLFMVGVVFAKGPAGLLAYLVSPSGTSTVIFAKEYFWLIVIIVYYFIATFVSVDKIIGKLYPIFGIILIVMAFGVAIGMSFGAITGVVIKGYAENIPELWTVFGQNLHPAGTSAWPMMFISVACGAISGFHSTQSPIMARCCKSEKDAKQVFFGAMVAEGIIALIWAAAACALFPIVGGRMVGLSEALASGQSACIYNICEITMGNVGVVIAMLGVIVCPITSGDTAFRAARLTLADWFKIDQKDWKKRLLLALPLLFLGYLVCGLDYTVVWDYFASTNQILAMIVLWAASVYLVQNGKKAWITLLPATFMSCVTMTCVLSSPLYLGNVFGEYSQTIGYVGGIVFAIIFLMLFFMKERKIVRTRI